jgi:corrinoid protein of di/trimethylamine methyltransferase
MRLKEVEILNALSDAVLKYDSDAAIGAAKASVAANINPVRAIEKGLASGLKQIGDKFEAGDAYLPHLVLGAEAMEAALKVLEQGMPKEEIDSISRGTIIIGTVEGDIHDLGLRIVASMLKANGFKVYDLGCNTQSLEFLEKAKEVNADIIAMSSLMTTTMPFMKDLIDVLKTAGQRQKFKVLVGGGPVSSEWAETIGADGYGKDASEAVKTAKELVKKE